MAKPKVIVQLYPMFPSDGEEDRKAKRPLGNDNEMYHRIVHEWTDIIKEADKMGVWGLGTIEHHFHSEGYEVGPNPGILNAYWASLVENAHVGALGYVMATHDPLRVAEETAILDHLTKGKYFVGFARGYQSRWANVMGQYTESPATVSDGSAADDRNRQIFEERVNMVIEAWTQESVRVKGEFYEAPFPFETGVEGYPAYEIARDAGAEGEIGPDGSVQRVCVVPKPYQQPHPPVFVAASKSQASIDYCARNGFIPTYFMPDKGVIEMTQYYQKVANENGFNVQLGQKQNLVRWPHVTKTSEDFDRKLREYDLDIYKNFYGPFFPQFPQGNDSELVQSMKDSQLFIGGTVDECVAGWKKIFDQAPCEYVTLIWHWAQQPKEDMMEELRLFMDEILPELEVPDFEDVSAAAE
ncbi:MAG: LLM class flavin-dependent oxidoreductase [Rhodospirillaceae bacterium]|jgi:alkanesulfonate monooxygenase SsuD/methylene tetrahydromethanopterin reductase-like flavin-dependent oxidoreductase (luciferase family)|nr:LLM class flavin-dependent oxidoreductase [Rhodospirillaceae bacterium]MBT4771174.1 LLM class flavin-dependent oxidoreductase [Rhodospirillaceae bacterium]MBT5357797.1 LLM class flavin-dependent oxidoreductase [Rhodospirillaceae bacterium]MBT5770104.1 LLM class flavin-dependent oxidoreductase [Rhodospirillaceae bacterium]MBT6310888.1 LLM class flavin-dependent oxidoreductase [Rhodospirillaceae bacterium]